MKQRKHFTVPECVGLVHGEKRIKLPSSHGMLLWYRRDLGSPIIGPKTFEEPVKCIAVRLGRRYYYKARDKGYLVYYNTNDEGSLHEDPSNYWISLGDYRFMTWRDSIPETMTLSREELKRCYLIGEHYNEYIKTLIKK